MDLAAGELPDEPGLHGAEEELPLLRPLPGPRDIVQDPFQLGAGEVGVHHQAGFLPDGVGVAGGLELVAVGAGAAALPDDGVAYRLAGGLVPDDGGLPLVGDADGGDVGGGSADFAHGLHRRPQLGGPDLVGVVLHPAGLGEDLGELLLGPAAHLPLLVEEDAAVAGGAGVEGHDVFRHSRCRSFRVSTWNAYTIAQNPQTGKGELRDRGIYCEKPADGRARPGGKGGWAVIGTARRHIGWGEGRNRMLSTALLLLKSSLFLSLHLSGNMSSFPKPLSGEEEQKYLERWAQGDLEARNILIERNMRLVAHIIKKG